ncbi:glycosyltransferase family 4 protein [Butyrivibrio sp. MC2013]|uniref:glycosyltransferase family 4 protein n=1 Tax=Butyrivibrio sp. MC2013 TaxID=1280686 RepID=UPI0003FA5DBF|nr:glycosyltransferase family 4 protein [Butyrivibrio sp. MC2013]
MKVLWLCNICLPVYARHENIPYSNREGWLSGCYGRIEKERKEGTCDLILGVCFPLSKELIGGQPYIRKDIDSVSFYPFEEDLDSPEEYKPELEDVFRQIIDDFQPDMIHVFGTEFPHSLAMIRAYDRPERTLLGLQGLCHIIGSRYMADLPPQVVKDRTIRDILKHDSLLQQQEKFIKRGENEIAAIKASGHIAGRTEFDRTAVAAINPAAGYHNLNETLRDEFYTGSWSEDKADPHSIFVSQGDYPIKGLHFILEAMPGILRKYPDAHLYVAGNSIIGNPDRSRVTGSDSGEGRSIYPLWLRIPAYGKYLRKLIREGSLEGHVTALGKLSAEQMKEQYLKASVFVCPSFVENSPNSVGEAMLLGTPLVASNACGIPSMVDDGRDGILYDPTDIKGLETAVSQIWEEKVISNIYSDNAREHAARTHDPDLNYSRLMEIYHAISG